MPNRFALAVFLWPVTVTNLAEDMPKCAVRYFMQCRRLLVSEINDCGALVFGQV